MPQLLARKMVTARKDHLCSCCYTVAIHGGDEYERKTYIYDNRVYSWVSCSGCAAIMPHVYEWAYEPDEGVGRDEFYEWANENRDDPEHGGAARAFLTRIGTPLSEGDN